MNHPNESDHSAASASGREAVVLPARRDVSGVDWRIDFAPSRWVTPLSASAPSTPAAWPGIMGERTELAGTTISGGKGPYMIRVGQRLRIP